MSATYLKHKDQLSCLVPSENAQKEGWVFTSHEKTLCDCTVQKIASEFQEEIDKLRKENKAHLDALKYQGSHLMALSKENEQLKADLREIQMGMGSWMV